MRFSRATFVVLFTAFFCTHPVTAQDAGAKTPGNKPPQWIWIDKTAHEKETIYLRKSFELIAEVKSGLLSAACDNTVTVFVNGQKVLQHDNWNTAAVADVAKLLVKGKNVIAAECYNGDGPGGFLLQLKTGSGSEAMPTLISDASWNVSREAPEEWRDAAFDASGWKKAVSLGELGVAPWGNIALNATAPSATPASELNVLPGFKVELLYSVPKASQGSWVSMTPDHKGRLIVSDQDGSLYRVTPGVSSQETRVEKINLEIGHSQGMLYAHGALYVVVNGNAAQGSGLYRLRDTNDDDEYDELKLLKKFEGGGEHGPHAVRLGPDGALYVIAGNFTKPPEGYDPLSPLRNFAEDQLLKRNPDGNGFATGVMAPGGWIAKTDADGQRWELHCAGFRNPYDFDFNADGEMFTFDADMEWDTGTPWYRPTRVNHTVSGGEFGWRYGTGKWPAYYIDSVGAVVDIGMGSPTGVQFGTGAKFPAKYQRAFYISDWTYGKLYAVHLIPAGATYTASFETFVSGKPLPLTDVCVNRDGALYFTVGGRGTQSGLYRVTYTGQESVAREKPVANPTAQTARAVRRKLEAFHSGTHPEAVEFAWPHLNSSERAIRYAARVAIEHQSLTLWKDKALAEKRVNAQLQSLVALSRVGAADLQPAVLERLNALPFKQLTEEQLLDTLRVYALAFIRLGGQQPETAAKVIETLDPLFPAESEFVNRELCKVLAYLEAPGIIDRGLAQLALAQTQQDQMFYVFTLRNVKTGWTESYRRTFFGWIALARGYRGGASFQKFLDQIRDDALAGMTDEEQAALKEVIDGSQKVEAVKLTTTRQFVHNWQFADLAPLLNQATKGRSFEKGKVAYEATQCAKCHRFRNEGGDTGPDISGVGNRFDARYILEALIEPSKIISDQYVNSIFALTDGRVVHGRVINQTADKLMVRTDPFAKELTEIRKADIEERMPSTVSEMPQGLINVLTPEEILDLIAYLRSGGDPSDKAFQAP